MGIDQSLEMLTLASRANRRAIREERVELSLGRFRALPRQDDSVDKILAVNVVCFFRRSAEDFLEARRILRRNGAMAVYATDRSTMCRWKFSGTDIRLIGNIDQPRPALNRPPDIAVEQRQHGLDDTGHECLPDPYRLHKAICSA